MKGNGRSILKRVAAVAMAILLVMPALPARAAEAGTDVEEVSMASGMELLAGGEALKQSISEMTLQKNPFPVEMR